MISIWGDSWVWAQFPSIMPLKLLFNNDRWIFTNKVQHKNHKSPCSKCKLYSEFMCYIACCPNTQGNFWWMFVMKKKELYLKQRPKGNSKGIVGIDISMFLKTIDSWIKKSLWNLWKIFESSSPYSKSHREIASF